MCRFVIALTASLVLWSSTLAAQSPPRPEPLPVKRVVLYKAGIGYFEHLGEVTGRGEVTINFTSGQLDDALKSLAAVDLGSGRVTGIRYNSVAPVSERLRALRLPVGEQISFASLLDALRGARVTARVGLNGLTGRLVSVDRLTRIRDGHPEAYSVVVVASDAGELRSFELTPALSITLGEVDLRREVDAYLGIIASARERDLRRMTVSTEGTGRRQLLVSYISEVPVWKVNYRLLLDSAGARKPLLQGWAIVDNTVGEDWTNVELSLVAGAPQSFIQHVSQPLYTRRPVVALPTTALLTPQTHQGALRQGTAGVRGRVLDPSGAALPGAQVELLNDRSAVIGKAVTGADGSFAFGPLAEATYQLRASLPGFSSRTVLTGVTAGAESVQDVQLSSAGVAESVSVTASTPRRERGVPGGVVGGIVGGLPGAPPPPPAPATRDEALAAIEAAATPGQLGDVFEYRIKEPITVRRNESALVPIARAEIEAEKVTLWSAASRRAYRAVWMTNSSGLTLDAGSFSIVEDGAFAGEGLLEAVRPGERRLLSYAGDPGVTVEARQDHEPSRVFRVQARHGLLLVQRETRQRWSYTVRNENDVARTVVLEHPLRSGWRTTPSVEVSETTTGAQRLKVVVDPHKSASVTLREVHPEETRFAMGQVGEDFVRLLVEGGLPAADVERALKPLLAKQAEIRDVEQQLALRHEEIATIESDQARLRENIRALGSTRADRGLVERYTRQMAAQEDRLEVLRREIARFEQDRKALEAEALRMLETIEFERQ